MTEHGLFSQNQTEEMHAGEMYDNHRRRGCAVRPVPLARRP